MGLMNQPMKICFVQPNTDYQVKKNRYALALTFPQLISDLNLEDTDYLVYIFGKMGKPFEIFLREQSPTHVFITSITSTFPHAEEIAGIAKEMGIIVVLGGLFASINYRVIASWFSCFDYIVGGHPDSSLISRIKDRPSQPEYIAYTTSSNYQKELGDIIIDKRFSDCFSEKETVCYELTNGCNYKCSFCTMRRAFPDQKLCRRSIKNIQHDISKLEGKWSKLKLIDDDIGNSLDILMQLDLTGFSEVVAETRIDRLSESYIKICKSAGITHLLVGLESFDTDFLVKSGKTTEPDRWIGRIMEGINLCRKYGICIRPILMVTNENTTIESLMEMSSYLEGWTPENNVELLISFYTPHPGMGSREQNKRLLTNDLRCFDHLHCVWLPPRIDYNEMSCLEEIYKEIVNKTESWEYNPLLKFSFDQIEKYNCFFK